MFKVIGALGLLIIIIGIIFKDRKWQNILFAIGGALLEVYSIYIKDYIFITLQAFFTLAAVYQLIKLKKR